MAYQLAAALGANLIGSLLSVRSERKRRQRLRERLLAENAPLEALLQQRQFGPTESEGNLMQVATQRTLSQLASQGVLNSSISAPAVAQAVAPIEEQRQRRTQGLLERVVAARQAIVEGTSLPGYGAAFGEAFGEAGDLMALLSAIGQREGNQKSQAGTEPAAIEPPSPLPEDDLEDFLGLQESESDYSPMQQLVNRGSGRGRKARYR